MYLILLEPLLVETMHKKVNLQFMEQCIARCVFYITNEMYEVCPCSSDVNRISELLSVAQASQF